MTEHTSFNALSRRNFVKSGIATGMVLSGGSILAACGGDSEGTAPGASMSSGATRKKGGTLRVGVAGGGKGNLDPHATTAVGADAIMPNLYDKLVDFDPLTYKAEPSVLESVAPNARGDRWTLRLRQEVKFHNGRTATADDVVYTFRHMGGKDTATIGALDLLGLESVRKVDARTVVLELSAPSAVLPETLAANQSYFIPKDFDPDTGVGTGAYKLKSRKPGEETSFVAFDDYWGDDGPYVDAVVLTEFAEATARVNAFLAGQLDAISEVPVSQQRIIAGNASLQVHTNKRSGWRGVVMCTTSAEFSSPLARQGMRLLIDRKQLVAQAYNGSGTVANDLYSPQDPLFNASLPARPHDPEKGMALLRQAGVTDRALVLRTNTGANGLKEIGQVVAQQAKAAGLNIKVQIMDPNSFYAGDYLHYPLGTSYWSTNPYLFQVSQIEWGKKAPYNQSQFDDPEFNDLVDRATRELDDAKRRDLAGQMQQIQYERGGLLIPAYSDRLDATTKKVVGVLADKRGQPLNQFQFRRLSFA